MRPISIPFLGVAVATLCFVSSASSAPTDSEKCLAAKQKAISKYELCVWKAHAKSTLTGGAVDTGLCQTKFEQQWVKPDAKYGADCPDTSAAAIVSLFSGHVADVLALISTAAVCGNGVVDSGEECDSSVGATCSGLGYGNGGTVVCSGTCTIDTSGCQGCSVFAQDCPTGTDACTLAGGGTTGCTPEGTATDGQSCEFEACAEGFVCVSDGVNLQCRQFCQPSQSSCTVGYACANIVDYDEIGACVPI